MYNKSIKKTTTFPSFFISWNFFVIFFLKYHFLMWMKWLWYPNSYYTRFFICFWTCFIFKFCQISTIFAYYFLIGRQSQRSYSQFDVSNDFNAFIYWLKTYFYQKYRGILDIGYWDISQKFIQLFTVLRIIRITARVLIQFTISSIL